MSDKKYHIETLAIHAGQDARPERLPADDLPRKQVFPAGEVAIRLYGMRKVRLARSAHRQAEVQRIRLAVQVLPAGVAPCHYVGKLGGDGLPRAFIGRTLLDVEHPRGRIVESPRHLP